MDRADIADVNGNSNTAEVLRFHYHQQALGSVTEVTQPSGAAVEWITYDVYGRPTLRSQTGGVVSSSAVGSPYLYTGREYDAESSKYHYRARAYDSESGRFLQRDPIGCEDGLSLYSYAHANPAGGRDPLGTTASFGKRLKDNAVKRAKELAKKELKFSGATAGTASGSSENWKPRDPSSVNENGLISKEGKAAEGIREIWENPSKFKLDCASAVFLIWFMAILDTLEDMNKGTTVCAETEANRIFNNMFPFLVLWGAWNSGTELGLKKLDEEHGMGEEDAGPKIFDVIEEEPSEAGDAGHVMEDDSSEPGENIMLLKDGEPEEEDKVYGHGPDHMPHGVQPLGKFEEKYGKLQKHTVRMNAGSIEKAAKKAKGSESR